MGRFLDTGVLLSGGCQATGVVPWRRSIRQGSGWGGSTSRTNGGSSTTYSATTSDHPEEEVHLCDPDGTVYAFIVPVQKRFGLVERGPEEWAELEASIGGDADPTFPADEVLSVLEAADGSAEVASRLEALRMRDR